MTDYKTITFEVKNHVSELSDRTAAKMPSPLPMGVSEDHVFFYETGLEPKKFLDFKGEVSRVDGELLWGYSRTVIAVIPE